MLRVCVTAFLYAIIAIVGCSDAADITDYNVVWTHLLPEPGNNSEGLLTYLNTMPLGNGDFASLVFVNESAGIVSFLTSKSDAWNEAGEMNSLGLVHVQFSPNPFTFGNYFRQELHLDKGIISIQLGGNSNTSAVVDIQCRVDAVSGNVLIADINFNEKVSSEIGVASWDISIGLEMLRPVMQQHSYPWECLNYDISADNVLVGTNEVYLYHRNSPTNYVQNTLSQLQLSDCLDRTPDAISMRTFGIMTELYQLSDGQTKIRLGNTNEQDKLTIKAESSGSYQVAIYALSAQTQSASDWLNAIKSISVMTGVPPLQPHLDWWTAYNNRSHLFISSSSANSFSSVLSSSDGLFNLSRQYALTRYVHAIQSRGIYPIRFNGYIFVANRPPNTDYRDWGSQNWWQNVRLPYYSMFASGDADQVQASLIGGFAFTYPFSQCQTEIYYGFKDSVFWTEYTGPFGAMHTQNYGCNRPQSAPGEPAWYSEDQWNHHNHQQNLDLSTFILDHFDYTQDINILKQNLPMVLGTVRFFYNKWSNQTDAKGYIVLYPTQSLETWQCPNYPWEADDCVTNDMPTIAGLKSVLPRVLSLPSGLVDPDTLSLVQKFLPMIGPLPTIIDTDGERLSPCEICPNYTMNVENTELYAVHPYRLFTVSKSSPADLALAQRAYQHMRFPADEGWDQTGMDAALIGNVVENAKLLIARAALGPAAGYRFPAFMPHLQDYEPSADHLANMANALYYALAQSLDDASGTVVLFPTWPCEWDIDFKIHAPRQTIITGQLLGGILQSIDVQPPERGQFVQIRKCTSLHTQNEQIQ